MDDEKKTDYTLIYREWLALAGCNTKQRRTEKRTRNLKAESSSTKQIRKN